MWLETVHQSKNHATKCPTCGGGVQRRAYGEMHAGSYLLDGKRVDIRRSPHEGFSDPIYLDPLTQYFDGGLYRIWPSETYLTRGGKKLHRDVWEGAFGPIPRGCHIHHRDRNPRNNVLSNLECIAAQHHLSEYGNRNRVLSAKALEKAAEWHRSEEGRLWHRRNAQRSKSWLKWKRVEKPCLFCQKPFQCLERKNGHAQKYCSPNCKAAAYRARNRSLRTR